MMKLTELIADSGITKAAISRATGISPQQLLRWTNGKHKVLRNAINTRRVEKLAKLLGATTEDVWDSLNAQEPTTLTLLLVEHGISQEELARQTGLTTASISYLHKTRPSTVTLRKIANALGYTPDELAKKCGWKTKKQQPVVVSNVTILLQNGNHNATKLADEAGISAATVRCIQNGRTPKLETAHKIWEALKNENCSE